MALDGDLEIYNDFCIDLEMEKIWRKEFLVEILNDIYKEKCNRRLYVLLQKYVIMAIPTKERGIIEILLKYFDKNIDNISFPEKIMILEILIDSLKDDPIFLPCLRHIENYYESINEHKYSQTKERNDKDIHDWLVRAKKSNDYLRCLIGSLESGDSMHIDLDQQSEAGEGEAGGIPIKVL